MSDDEIDIAALAIVAAPAPKGDKQKPPRWTLAGGRSSRARFAPGERRARVRANGMRLAAVAHARRGFTFEHRLATLMAPGVEYTTRDLWKLAEGKPKSRVANALRQMWQRGVLARRRIEGVPERTRTAHARTGKAMWWNESKWLYSLTPKGEAYATEGRLRQMLE